MERSLDRPGGLTYTARGELLDLRVGERVEAPLGRGGRLAAGVVVEVDVEPDFDPAKIKAVARRTGVSLPSELIDLARWVSSYYCCPVGMTLAAMLPAAVKARTGESRRVEVYRTGAAPETKLPKKTREVWERIAALGDEAFPMTPKELVLTVEAGSMGPINRLKKLGLLEERSKRIVKAGPFEIAPDTKAPPELTAQQREAVDRIAGTLGAFAPHLLFGVTGSGKTEVYLRLIERTLQRGEVALVLVPEISLTPQTVSRFAGRFAEAGVAVMHSGLTAAQRHAQWAMAREGRARIVIGARSAVFAPFDRELGASLGLIVVDEEHDSAYKQEDSQPRHHGRDVAIKRAQMNSCPIVLGSATPSLESWRHAREGRYALHRLTERPAGAVMPRARLVDLREELKHDQTPLTRDALLGPTLRAALRETLDAGGQAVLLLNRRGFASFIACAGRDCEWTLRCDSCDANMVHHRAGVPAGGIVRCHHCLAEKRVPRRCPLCESRIRLMGAGSQRAEEALLEAMPDLAGGALERLDSDTMRRAADWFTALSRFASGETRVLLGTQMIGKGLDFPNVRLVGVLSADTGLALPDFRAAERTFQLVAQVAGRAGRAREPGRVVIQTFAPDERAIVLASRHDYQRFADEELAVRRETELPPVWRAARIVVRDEDEAKAKAQVEEIAGFAASLSEAALRIEGPAPCVISRVQDRFRFELVLSAPTAGVVQRALAAIRSAGLAKNDRQTAVDVDPLSML
jgi:primosomal protein N' (replication factor Y) (superfamily II helicase)